MVLFRDYLSLLYFLDTFFHVFISRRAHSLESSWVEGVIGIGLSEVFKAGGCHIRSADSILQRSVPFLFSFVDFLKGFTIAFCFDIKLSMFYVGVGQKKVNTMAKFMIRGAGPQVGRPEIHGQLHMLPAVSDPEVAIGIAGIVG